MPPSREEDGTLLVRAKSGDPRAIDDLVRRWRPYVLAVCRAWSRDADRALDAVQEVMVRLLLNLGRLDPKKSLRGWLATVARNVCRDAAEAQAHEGQHLLPQPAGDGADNLIEGVVDPAGDPLARLLAASTWEAVEHCLACLGGSRRLLVELHYLDELHPRKIVALCPDLFPHGWRRSTYFHQLRQAREAVRRCVEALERDAPAREERSPLASTPRTRG